MVATPEDAGKCGVDVGVELSSRGDIELTHSQETKKGQHEGSHEHPLGGPLSQLGENLSQLTGSEPDLVLRKMSRHKKSHPTGTSRTAKRACQ